MTPTPERPRKPRSSAVARQASSPPGEASAQAAEAPSHPTEAPQFAAFEAPQAAAGEASILGLPIDRLAGLTADDIINNRTAVTMLLHYYRLLSEGNRSLRTEIDSLRTYQEGYQRNRWLSGMAGVLFAISNVFVGIGAGFLTAGQTNTGIGILVPGLLLFAGAVVFLLWDIIAGKAKK